MKPRELMGLSKSESLQFVEFLAIVESLMGIVVGVNPSLFDFQSSIDIGSFFILNYLVIIIFLIWIYGRLLTGKTISRDYIYPLAGYFGLGIGIPIGASIVKFGEFTNTPLWVPLLLALVPYFIVSYALIAPLREISVP